jgi:anti-sigma regulatory factor (Ser/Thr protein kinase)
MTAEGAGGDVCIVHVHGHPFPRAAARLSGLLASELRRHGVVVVDLDSAHDHLVGALRAALRRAGRWPLADLHVSAPDPAVAQGCRDLGLHREATIHDSLPQAVAAARAQLPLVSARLSLPAGPRSPQQARAMVKDVCGGRVPDTVARDATLVVSELATNAVRHAGEPIEVISLLTRERLVVAVHDSSPAAPVVAGAGQWHESGRGLVIVEAVSQTWGVHTQDGDGKTVWSSFSIQA